MIEEIQLNYKIFKDKSTVIYGASDTGKSTVIKNILFALKDKIHQIIVFVGNEDCFQSYNTIVPHPLIHRRITKEILERIWKRQEALMYAFNRANNPAILKNICLRISDNTYLENKIRELNVARKKCIVGIIHKYNDTIKQNTYISKVKSIYQKNLKKIYVNFIKSNEKELHANNDLTDDEKYTLKYYDINPRMLIVMDDLMHCIKNLKNTVFDDIFFQGRHKLITFILSLQDDKGLPSELRKNSFVNIFTTRICATSLFNRPSNNYDKEIKDKAREACEDTFTSSNSFQKLIHIRKGDLFFRFTANVIDDSFTFVPKTIDDYCRSISSDENTIDETNPYWDLLKS